MQAERRCVERKRPGGISYFEFEAGSGGIVLDASEKGLRFQAAGAVSSRVWISPRPEERIEVTGNVVWTDASRKTGGLRFIETRTDSSKKISAEIELARLYLRGEGVPRNCVQAKVLLRPAAKSGSVEARQQLKKLRHSVSR